MLYLHLIRRTSSRLLSATTCQQQRQSLLVSSSSTGASSSILGGSFSWNNNCYNNNNATTRSKHSSTQIKRLFKQNPAKRRIALKEKKVNGDGDEGIIPESTLSPIILEPIILKNGWNPPLGGEDAKQLELPDYPFRVARTRNKPNNAVGFLPVYSEHRWASVYPPYMHSYIHTIIIIFLLSFLFLEDRKEPELFFVIDFNVALVMMISRWWTRIRYITILTGSLFYLVWSGFIWYPVSFWSNKQQKGWCSSHNQDQKSLGRSRSVPEWIESSLANSYSKESEGRHYSHSHRRNYWSKGQPRIGSENMVGWSWILGKMKFHWVENKIK